MNRPNQMRTRSLYLSDTVFAKFKHVYNTSLASTGTSNGVFFMRGNGPYDPVVAVGGNFPAGWSFWSGAYKRYICYGSKIKVTFTNNGDWPAEVFIIPTVSQTFDLATNAEDIAENPYNHKKYITTNAGSHGQTTVKHYMSTAKIYGIPKKKVTAEDDFSAETNTTPLRQWFWAVGQWNFGDNLDIATFCIVETTYYVRLWDRRLLT